MAPLAPPGSATGTKQDSLVYWNQCVPHELTVGNYFHENVQDKLLQKAMKSFQVRESPFVLQ